MSPSLGSSPVPETPGSCVHSPELVEKGAKAYWESLGCRWAEADGYQRDKARAVSEAVLSVVPAGGEGRLREALEEIRDHGDECDYWKGEGCEVSMREIALSALSASHPDDEHCDETNPGWMEPPWDDEPCPECSPPVDPFTVKRIVEDAQAQAAPIREAYLNGMRAGADYSEKYGPDKARVIADSIEGPFTPAPEGEEG